MKALRFLKGNIALGATLFLTAGTALAAQGVPLSGSKIAQFVDPLPLLSVAPGGTMQTVLPGVLGGTDSITVRMIETQTKMMPTGFVPANGQAYTGTWVFRYVADSGPGVIGGGNPDTYLGPVIVAARNHPTEIKYVNNLTTNHIFWRDWTDQSMHSAFHQIYGMEMPTAGDTAHYPGPVPAVPHLHGGEDPAVVDGGPEAYFLSDQGDFTGVKATRGPAYYSKAGALSNEAIYRYPNSQIAAPLWFHDHLLGGTRLNATFAGLAGAYPIIDTTLTLPAGLHPAGLVNADGVTNLRYSVPLVFQDRMFDTNGQLFFPNVGLNPTIHPYWVPEFVGDTMVVNGKVWPYLNVDRQRYRFFMINGSNSRPYDMFLQDPTTGIKGPRMWVIATDGGYLDRPVLIDPNATGAQTKAGVAKSLVMMPGERYEVIIDFADPTWLAAITAAYGGTVPNPVNLLLRNTAPTVLGNPKTSTEGRLMQFRVSANAPSDTSYNPASGTPILTGEQAIKRLVNPATGVLGAGVTVNVTRQLVLNEVPGLGGPLEVLVNNSKWNGLRENTMTPIPGSMLVNGNYLTELPKEGDIEVWEIVNTTMDKHPIHLHGVQFQILNRQAFDTKAFAAAYAAAFPGGVLMPGYGPPLDYFTGNPRALGGNPDPVLLGAAVPPFAYEAGWKDTSIMSPGEVTRIAVRIAPQDTPIGTKGSFPFTPNAPADNGQPGTYVWHCHITDHEDNEMMRPDMFVPNSSATRTFIQGLDY